MRRVFGLQKTAETTKSAQACPRCVRSRFLLGRGGETLDWWVFGRMIGLVKKRGLHDNKRLDAAVADFAGGELRFYEQRKHGDRGEVVLPTRGTVELFSSGWENMHEVSKLVSENVRKHASKLSIPRVVIPRPACYKDSTRPPLHDPTLDLRTYLRLNRWRASLRGSATRSPYSSPRSNLQRPHRGEAREARARTTAQHAPPRCLSLAMSETRPIRDSIWPASAARTAEEQAGRRMG